MFPIGRKLNMETQGKTNIEKHFLIFKKAQKDQSSFLTDRILNDTISFKTYCLKLQKQGFCNEKNCFYQHHSHMIICKDIVNKKGLKISF